MGFRSPLNSIVRLRRLLEERQETGFRSSQLKLNDCIATLERLCEMERSLAGVAGSCLEPTWAVELHVSEMRRRTLHLALTSVKARLETCRKDVDVERKKLEHLRQEREKVETLRDLAKEQWSQKNARAEQRFVDEMYLIRRSRERSGGGTAESLT